MNIVCLCGNVAKDLKTNQSGKVAYTSLAVSSSEKNEDGKYKARFIPLRFLGEKTVETVTKYIQKGTKIGVTGELVIDDVKQEDGSYKTYAYVIIRTWEFAGSKADKPENKPESRQDDEFESIPSGDEADLPFS